MPKILRFGAGHAENVITLVACSPLFSAAERLIAYRVFASFARVSHEPPRTP